MRKMLEKLGDVHTLTRNIIREKSNSNTTKRKKININTNYINVDVYICNTI